MVSFKVLVKPLSVNQCWQGKRFKTKKYQWYEKVVFYSLPKIIIPDGKLKIDIEFGFSSPLADIDNPIKPFLDILQKKYSFNDKNIIEMSVKKLVTKKGDEYIKFVISKIN